MILKIALLLLLVGQAPVEEPVETEQPPAATETVEAPQGGEAVETEATDGETAADEEGAAEGEQQQKRPNWIMWVILLGVLVVFYLLMILPQRRRQKKHQQMLKALNRGDRVVTNGGIVGTIARVKEDTFVIKTAGKTELEIDKNVVASKK